MKIAFYAPLKAPGHPIPSGDRLMARQLMQALGAAGHDVVLASELRSYSRQCPDAAASRNMADAAAREADRLAGMWELSGAPDVWFCYHPYYKAPDLIGPGLARRHGAAYVTAETSFSNRAQMTDWAARQDIVADGIRLAAVNICFTGRDRDGIAGAVPGARIAMLKPFIGSAPFGADRHPGHHRLLTVAMMRPGDKMKSYAMLADALKRLPKTVSWGLTVIGDGAMQAEVRTQFAMLPTDRIVWSGERSAEEVARLMADSDLYVWPGYGEAYGLAYLEAQAAGLPVIAQRIAGVPEVVLDGVTGLLTRPDDADGFAAAIQRLLENSDERLVMSEAARQFARTERSLDQAARRLGEILATFAGSPI